MLPPEAYERARREAELLIQLSIESVDIEDLHAMVGGPVIGVFRGPRTAIGRRMRLRAPIAKSESKGRPSGVAYTPVEQLRPGRVLEAYVNEDASGPQLVLGMCTVLDGATEHSVLEERLGPPATPAPTRSPKLWMVGLLAMLLLGAVAFWMR